MQLHVLALEKTNTNLVVHPNCKWAGQLTVC